MVFVVVIQCIISSSEHHTSWIYPLLCYCCLVFWSVPTHVSHVCLLFSVVGCRSGSVYSLDLHWHVVIVCIALSMQPMYVISCSVFPSVLDMLLLITHPGLVHHLMYVGL